MAGQLVTDYDGNTMRLTVMRNTPWAFSAPGFNNQFLEHLPDYPLRDDDILFCSFPKSGCHWVWEITRMLLSGTDKLDDVSKEAYFMELHQTKHGSDLDLLPSPRVLNNHHDFVQQPVDMLKKQTKVVLVYRNPKDVAVSYFQHIKSHPGATYTGETFRTFLRRFADGLVVSGFVCDYLREWERGVKGNQNINICVISYEDLQENPLREVRKLSKFLEKGHDEGFLEKVIQETHIDNMRRVKTGGGNPVRKALYRKGEVGDWKNYFTVADSEWFDHIIRVRMAGSNMFHFRYHI